MIYDDVELSTDIDMSMTISLPTDSEESSDEETVDHAELYEMECAKNHSSSAADESIEDRADNAGFSFLEHFQAQAREVSPAPVRPLLTLLSSTNVGTAQPAPTPTQSPRKEEHAAEHTGEDNISYLSEYPTYMNEYMNVHEYI